MSNELSTTQKLESMIEEIDGWCYNSCYLIEVKGLEKA